MSEKEYAKTLIDNIPSEMLGNVIAYMQGILANDSMDDVFCEILFENYQNDSDKDSFISFEEMAKKCGVNPYEL